MSWCCTVGKSVAKGRYKDVTDKEVIESDIEARLSHTRQLWSLPPEFQGLLAPTQYGRRPDSLLAFGVSLAPQGYQQST